MLLCVVCHNDEPIKTYELADPVITIGRLPENTISIANMGVSRRHVRIERDTNRNYVLVDLNSLNGTLLNNQKTKRSVLAPGDKITIGKYTIHIEGIDLNDDVAVVPPAQPEGTPDVAPPGIDIGEQLPPPSAQPVAAAGVGNGPVFIDTDKHMVFSLNKRVMSIGCSETDDIIVSGFKINDSHLLIERRDDGFWLTSGKKTVRFKVNGKKTNNHHLRHKDRIEIGDTTFAFMENS